MEWLKKHWRGLLEYARMERRWPAACGVGILPFGNEDVDAGFVPMIFEPKFRLTAYALVFAPPRVVVGLLFWSMKREIPQVSALSALRWNRFLERTATRPPPQRVLSLGSPHP